MASLYKINKGIRLQGQASAPTSPQDGSIYYDTTLLSFQFRQNGIWSALPSGAFNNGGNAFGGDATLGTTDNHNLIIITHNLEAARFDTNQCFRVGTTTPIISAGERVSVEYDSTAAATQDTTGLVVRQIISGNTAITSGQPNGMISRMRRSITSNTTDSFPNVIASGAFLWDINPGSSSTYTFANNGNNPIASVLAYLPTNIGAGTSAVNFIAGVYIRNTGGSSTGARVAGLFLDGVTTGSTGNAYITDNNTFSGTYFIHATNTNPSAHYGQFWIGSNSQNNAQLFVGTNGASSLLSSTSQIGINQNALIGSAATSSAYGMSSNINLQNATFTVGVAAHYQASGQLSTNGGSGAVTRLISFYSTQAPTSGSNNAVLSDNASFSGNYFLNQSGTTNSSLVNGGWQVGTNTEQLSFSNTGGTVISTIQNTNASNTSSSALVTVVVQHGGGQAGVRVGASGIENVTMLYDDSTSHFRMQAANNSIDLMDYVQAANDKRLGLMGDNSAGNYITVGNSTGNSIGVVNSSAAVIMALATSNTSNTTSLISFSANSTTAASSYTTGYRAGFYSANTAKGSTSTITTDIAYAGVYPSQGTNNLFMTDSTSATGNWGIYLTTSNPSFFNGQIQSGGSVTTPGIVFGNTNTGLYAGGSNALGIATLGVQAGLIDSSQQWTIGKVGSTATHQVYGDGFNMNSKSGDTLTWQLSALGGSLSRQWWTGSSSSSSTTQFELAGFYNDGSTTRQLGSLLFLNTNATASSSGGAIIIETRSTSGTTNGNYTYWDNTGGVRIGGITGPVNSTQEQVSIRNDQTAAATTDYGMLTSFMGITGNTAITSGQPTAGTFRWRRNITSSTSDNFGNVVSGMSALIDINPSSGQTYTWANSGSSPLSTITAYLPSNIGGGTSAVNVTTSFYARGVGGTSGARAIAFYSDGVATGSTGNALFADNVSFTGTYAIHSTFANPSHINGPFWIGVDSETNVQFYVGTSGASSNLTGTGQVGLQQNALMGSGATSTIYSIASGINLQNSSATTATAAFYQANNTISTNGGTQAFTRLITFYTTGAPSFATNNAILADNNTFSGNYGINLSTTNKNLLSGPTTIGGTTTNDSASSGQVGEILTGTNSSGTNVPNNTITNITSVSLTAGDWDVQGFVNFTTSITTSSQLQCMISTSSTTQSGQLYDGSVTTLPINSNGTSVSFGTGVIRVSLASTTTYFMNALAAFSAGSASNTKGTIRARRVR